MSKDAPCFLYNGLQTTELDAMTLQQMVNAIKDRPDFERVGMIACHNGVVRATSRDGRDVKGLSIEVDRDALQSIVQEMRQRSGIIEVAVHLFDGYRQIGDDVMLVAVAGDIREHVFPVLEETVERLKKEVTHKKEYYVE
ncbi:MAG: molybdenum cofactor biosynthesis protein MoaE [Syntrophobacteria bacterium]|nr:molybdenum cofactor biosynthesis protein MoaE [Deltaproteobacteria bacterium]